MPASLSSISVPRKTSSVTTDYVIPRVERNGRYFASAMCIEYPYKTLAIMCAEQDLSFHTYLIGTGK